VRGFGAPASAHLRTARPSTGTATGQDPAIEWQFNPDQALCLHRRRSSTPITADCKPLTCRNVALTTDNIAALQEGISGIDEHLRHRPPLLPPLLQARLTDRRNSIAEFLAKQSPASA